MLGDLGPAEHEVADQFDGDLPHAGGAVHETGVDPPPHVRLGDARRDITTLDESELTGLNAPFLQLFKYS